MNKMSLVNIMNLYLHIKHYQIISYFNNNNYHNFNKMFLNDNYQFQNNTSIYSKNIDKLYPHPHLIIYLIS